MKPYPKISEKCKERLLLKVYRIGSISVSATLEDSDGVKKHMGLGTNLTEALKSLEKSL